ncbi:hypothetical protein B0T20DRAFT_421316 [Sordaria brevicollis]|uniref:Uncharacterized protein n=1 Tax=Sordaria brevicollis TaxID=83679 RepID=A0AAE0P394_SORBR|nr:hypothetical protein B0T20DRAFT_421316 [Sordaria brevicollis]
MPRTRWPFPQLPFRSISLLIGLLHSPSTLTLELIPLGFPSCPLSPSSPNSLQDFNFLQRTLSNSLLHSAWLFVLVNFN